MASLGSLVIELAANTARLQSDMGKAVGIVERGASKMKGVFKALGVVGGGGFLAAVIGNTAKEAIKLGDEIGKAATKAGIGGRAMSQLAYAAKLADVDIASLSTAIKKMQVSLSEAGSGAKQPISTLKALGVTIEDLQKRKPEAQFELLGDRISRLKDPADRARAATELFGKAGADLLPLFEQGASGIAKARFEAEKLGISIGDEQIKPLSEADESIKRMTASWEAFAAKATAFFAPAIASITDALAGIDTRSLDQQIAAVDKMIQRASSVGFGPGVDSQKALAGLVQQRSDLVGRRELAQVRALQTGTSGGPTGRIRTLVDPIGFAPDTSDSDKEMENLIDSIGKTAEEVSEQTNALIRAQIEESNEAWQEELLNWQDFQDARLEAEEETNRSIAKMRDEQNKKLSEGAMIFRDAFVNAWDDMVNTGKLKIDELVKYIIAEFSKRALVNLLDKAFSGLGKNSSGDGFLGWLGSAFGSAFGGARASGGPVSAGRTYLVGEKGPELLRMGAAGSIIPNNQVGGGVTIAPVYQIDARGATTDLVKALPAILKQNNESLRNDLITGIRRRKYPIGLPA